MKLTDSMIKALKPSDTTQQYADGGGLTLYAYPNGKKRFILRYRFANKASMHTIGDYPSTTLKQAREQRLVIRKLLDTGISPMIQKKQEETQTKLNASNTFKSVAQQWHSDWQGDKSPKHQREVWNRLESDLFPHLGNLPIQDITTPTILHVIKKIEERGAIELAKRALQNCNQIFRYGKTLGLCTQNPVIDIKPSDVLKTREVTHHPRVSEDELPELLRKIDSYSESDKCTSLTQMGLQLITLTFVRESELTQAKWSEINFGSKRWTIPAERMKVNKTHVIDLSNQAFLIFKAIYEITKHREYIFPNQNNPLKPMSNNTLLYALYRMGYRGRQTVHGFRGIASTILHEQAYKPEHIEIQLAHLTGNKVSRAYNSAQYLPERKKMLQDWADYLDRIKQPKIIQFPRNA
jgi:integrase